MIWLLLVATAATVYLDTVGKPSHNSGFRKDTILILSVNIVLWTKYALYVHHHAQIMSTHFAFFVKNMI